MTVDARDPAPISENSNVLSPAVHSDACDNGLSIAIFDTLTIDAAAVTHYVYPILEIDRIRRRKASSIEPPSRLGRAERSKLSVVHDVFPFCWLSVLMVIPALA